MFLDYLKRFLVKKTIEDSLLKCKRSSFLGDVKTIGLIVDEHYFANTQSLIEELVSYGIAKENIELLLFKSKSQVDFGVKTIKFTAAHLNWNAQIKNIEVQEFIAKEFDVLINYYDVEKAILLVATHESRANFKVGFSNIGKNLNDFMINTNLGNYKVFIQELFRYIKILNKNRN